MQLELLGNNTIQRGAKQRNSIYLAMLECFRARPVRSHTEGYCSFGALLLASTRGQKPKERPGERRN